MKTCDYILGLGFMSKPGAQRTDRHKLMAISLPEKCIWPLAMTLTSDL